MSDLPVKVLPYDVRSWFSHCKLDMDLPVVLAVNLPIKYENGYYFEQYNNPTPINFDKLKEQQTTSLYECDQCDYSAISLKLLSGHMVKHSDNRPFKCNLCEYSAKRRSNLVHHTEKHSDDRPFKCKQCDYTAKNTTHLQTHARIHSQLRPFKCDQCDFASKYNQHLKHHLEKNHNKK